MPDLIAKLLGIKPDAPKPSNIFELIWGVEHGRKMVEQGPWAPGELYKAICRNPHRPTNYYERI